MSKENVQVVNQKVAEENKDKQELVLINEETIRNKIYVIREYSGVRVPTVRA